MKSSYLRAGIALACALGLSACGGGGAGDIYLGGTVGGVSKDGLVLQNNGGSDLAIPIGSSTFVFPQLIGTDTAYNVTIKSSPPNADCSIVGGQGTSGPFNVTTIMVTCLTHTHALTGTVTGLTADKLVVVNGSDSETIPATTTGSSTFAMAKVAEDAPYGITILTQPAGLTCSIGNGVGKMGTADVNNVQISCVPAA